MPLPETVRTEEWNLRLIVLGIQEFKKNEIDNARNSFEVSGIDPDTTMRIIDNFPDDLSGSESLERNIFQTIKWVENYLYYHENVEIAQWA